MVSGLFVQRVAAAALLTVPVVGADRTLEITVPSAPARSSGPAPAPPDMCSLLTEQEAEEILGKRLEPPQKQRSGDCWYLNEGGKDFGDVVLIMHVLPVQIRSKAEFDRFIADQVKKLNEAITKAGGKGPPFIAEPEQGVGAPAYYMDPGLYVLKGARVLMIGCERPQALRIAATALPRFQP
jgi:hypothetical protein